ncbi:conjugative transposon protein TraN [Algoriphagus aquimarinus]|uniref:Bacteroides conjugative transposon TraN protein n=1 Tax=Algoriphagus aquimarinus TaxID=237018 RepID=A0A1I1BNC5_9BACT|nr:conjugative transposon protein TraN [Algoriphagus aquimarinus]SFB49960.1 Bacteroides conjugative transposon TraN protein [Algoriphagus aquimarinus]
MNSNKLIKCTLTIALGGLLSIVNWNLLAQSNSPFTTKAITAVPIQISEQLTTNLIFPQAIKSVDRGNREIMVQRANAVENILQVKAENSELTNSNLTVITSDGQFYSFKVSYSADPQQLNLTIQPGSINPPVEFPKGTSNEVAVLETAQKVAVKNRRIKPIRQRKYKTGLSLTGIYIEEDLLYFQIKLENQTNIKYDVEQFRFFIRDNRKGKRTAVQELEQIPIQILGNTDQIPAQSTQTIVVALAKFTIPDQKHLGIELMEQNGGRNLKVKVKNHHIIQAAVVE